MIESELASAPADACVGAAGDSGRPLTLRLQLFDIAAASQLRTT
ncbi:MAG TPA: hypothetical protein VGD41_05110 [Pyrinomonadaceae bacterium]